MNDLYGRGIIEWDTYSDLMCRWSCGIPSSKRNKKEPQTIMTNMFGSEENDQSINDGNQNLQDNSEQQNFAQQKENEMDIVQQQMQNTSNKKSSSSFQNKKKSKWFNKCST